MWMILPATAPVRPDEIRSEIWWPCLFIPSLPSVLKKKKKKKAHTILLFPLSLADGHKGRGREKAWADKQTEGEMKDHKRSSREDGRHHFQTWKKKPSFHDLSFFFLAWQQNMYDMIRFF